MEKTAPSGDSTRERHPVGPVLLHLEVRTQAFVVAADMGDGHFRQLRGNLSNGCCPRADELLPDAGDYGARGAEAAGEPGVGADRFAAIAARR
ncbi:MAG: hypothetical protein OXE96_07465 [Gemmatimonadetes bacterium]|nr:hypothetical protein [Gemmatimonadota bacterium]